MRPELIWGVESGLIVKLNFKDELGLKFNIKTTKIMAAVIFHSNFGTQDNEICHCFRFFPIYLP